MPERPRQESCAAIAGTFRVVYVAKLAEAIYVLHCFQKKTQKTGRPDLDLAGRRYRELMKELLK